MITYEVKQTYNRRGQIEASVVKGSYVDTRVPQKSYEIAEAYSNPNSYSSNKQDYGVA